MRIWCGNVSKTMAKFGYPHPAMEGESLSQAILEFDQNVTGIFEGILTEVTNFSPETPFGSPALWENWLSVWVDLE